MTRPVIVGGGLAGGAAAARLARLGRSPLLLEREVGPHDKVCGEFLSIEARAHLAALGLDVTRLGGPRIERLRLTSGHRTVEAPLPFAATAISRRLLDAALLEHAARLGAEICYGASVRSIEAGRAVTAAGPIDAGPLLLASGKHELRGVRRERQGTITDLVGFKQYFRPTARLRARLRGVVELVAFSGGYAGLLVVEDDRLNLCLLVERRALAALGGWHALFAWLVSHPSLAALAEAEPVLAKPLTVSALPFGFLARPASSDALWRLGDQAAVIPSFSGDGMALALHSGRLAADMLASGASAPAFQARLRRDVARQVHLAMGLQRLGGTALGRFVLLTGLAAAPSSLTTLARWTRVRASAVARATASSFEPKASIERF